MAWTVQCTIDEGAQKIGTVAATFTAQDGATFTYSRRVNGDLPPDVQAFVAEAKAALVDAAARRTREASAATTIENLLNG